MSERTSCYSTTITANSSADGKPLYFLSLAQIIFGILFVLALHVENDNFLNWASKG